MAEPVRKAATDFLTTALDADFSHPLPRKSEGAVAEVRVHGYVVDYSIPSQDEIHAHNPELDELFGNSKVVSHNPE